MLMSSLSEMGDNLLKLKESNLDDTLKYRGSNEKN